MSLLDFFWLAANAKTSAFNLEVALLLAARKAQFCAHFVLTFQSTPTLRKFDRGSLLRPPNLNFDQAHPRMISP